MNAAPPAAAAAAAAAPAGATWPGVLGPLVGGADLPPAATAWAMRSIMAGDATPAQVAAFLIALRAKGETAAEVGALAAVMLELAAPLPLPAAGVRVDTCGTGGDRRNTVNISTMAALVVAGCGYQVTKHGNRAATSAAGSADVLEALGVVVDLTPDEVAAALASGAPVFCFAPVFHPALRHAGPVRSQLGVPTVFNVLGPLTNPARPSAQVVGVADARLAPVLAGVLAARGTSALVVRGDDGLDEVTTAAGTAVWEVRAGAVRPERIDPAALGLRSGDLTGGDAAANAAVARAVLAGAAGPVRDAVLINAAAALVAADAVGADPEPSATLHDRLAAALPRAAASIDTGAADAALHRWAAASHAARRAGARS